MLDDWSLTQNAFQKSMFNRLINRTFLSQAAMVHCTAEFEMQQIERNFYGFKNMTCVVPFVIPSVSASIDKEMIYQAFPEIDRNLSR